MKTAKTLKQINAQCWRILCNITKSPMPPAEQVAQMKKVTAIAKRYRRNAANHIKEVGIDVDMFGYLPVSAEIYMR